jgi:nicotinate-nucleotide adenylyltransferase
MQINITEADLDAIRSVIPDYYSPKRISHALSVERECTVLAGIYGFSKCDTLRLRAAALLHDVTKKLSHPKQLAYCRENGIPVTETEKHIPKIMHSRTGAHFAKKLFGELIDDGIYDAILYHTTAKPAMELMTALLYLADYIEPERDFPDCIMLRAEFYALLDGRDKYEALNETLVLSFGYTLSGLLAERGLVHESIVAARNYYLLQTDKDINLK